MPGTTCDPRVHGFRRARAILWRRYTGQRLIMRMPGAGGCCPLLLRGQARKMPGAGPTIASSMPATPCLAPAAAQAPRRNGGQPGAMRAAEKHGDASVISPVTSPIAWLWKRARRTPCANATHRIDQECCKRGLRPVTRCSGQIPKGHGDLDEGLLRLHMASAYIPPSD